MSQKGNRNEARVSALQEQECLVRSRLLDEERRRREEAERRLQDETCHRQLLVEKEVKMRAKNFSQVGNNAQQPYTTPLLECIQ